MSVGSLPDILRQAYLSFAAQIHTALPGVIEEYDAAKKKATVTPMIKKVFESGDVFSMPKIDSVPVIFPGTADALLHYPLKKGDPVLLLFAERSIERWLSGDGSEVEPGDPRWFSLTDCIAVPGLFPFGAPGKTGSETDALEILYKDAKILIKSDEISLEYDGGKIELKSGGTVSINNGNLEVLK